MLIVLEGVDGAGKTTLADLLLEAHDGPSEIQHKGPLKINPLVEYEWSMRSYNRTDLSHLLVADRWHVGELIYGPLYRGKSQLTKGMRQHVEMFLQSRGAVTRVVHAPVETIKRRLRDRGEDLLEDGHVGLVWDFYNEYVEANDGWELIRSTIDPIDLLENARRAQEEVFQLELLRSYVGPPRPRFLLVGSHASRISGNVQHFPAFAPYPGSFGSFLMAGLCHHGLKDYGLLNVNVDQDLTVADIVLRFPNVIAFGARAEQACKKAGIDPLLALPESGFDQHTHLRLKEAMS